MSEGRELWDGLTTLIVLATRTSLRSGSETRTSEVVPSETDHARDTQTCLRTLNKGGNSTACLVTVTGFLGDPRD